MLQKLTFDIVLVDDTIAAQESYNDHESIALSEIYQFALAQNPKTIFVYFFEKATTYFREFEKKNYSTLLFVKERFQPSRLAFALGFLKRRPFRTFYLADIQKDGAYPHDFYFYDEKTQKMGVFLQKNTPFSPEKAQSIRALGLNNVFIETNDFKNYYKDEKHFQVKYPYFSLSMSNIRRRYKYAMIALLDDSGNKNVQKGKKVFEELNSISEELKTVMSKYGDLRAALSDLPYKRVGHLAHGINTCLYALGFSRQVLGHSCAKLAVSFLLHDIGMSRVDFHLIKKKQTGKVPLEEEDRIELQQHVYYTQEICQEKMLPLDPSYMDIMMSHHEYCDGTGHPFGKREGKLSERARLGSLIDSFDRMRSVAEGQKVADLAEIIEKMKQRMGPFDEAMFPQKELMAIEVLVKNKQKKAA